VEKLINRIGCRNGRGAAEARRRAFTLAELIVGLLLLAIIGGATAAVAAAMSRGWQIGQTTNAASLTVTRTMLRIQDKVQRAKVIGQWCAGSLSASENVPAAAVLFWRGDDNADGAMQLDETQLLEYDRATQSLVLWEASFPDPVTRTAQNGPFPSAMLSEPNAINDYKQLMHKKTYPMTRNVLGATFNVVVPSHAPNRPTLEFRVKMVGPNGPTVEYGAASPRAPH
jgi:type II secretory pathway pseudopilin PulG